MTNLNDSNQNILFAQVLQNASTSKGIYIIQASLSVEGAVSSASRVVSGLG